MCPFRTGSLLSYQNICHRRVPNHALTENPIDGERSWHAATARILLSARRGTGVYVVVVHQTLVRYNSVLIVENILLRWDHLPVQ